MMMPWPAALPATDIIYVNAGVVAPPASWLKALKPGGRLVFPWRPTHDIGLAILVTAAPRGYAARSLGSAWFIPCVGASDEGTTLRKPGPREAASVKAIVLNAERAPDATAVAIPTSGSPPDRRPEVPHAISSYSAG